MYIYVYVYSHLVKGRESLCPFVCFPELAVSKNVKRKCLICVGMGLINTSLCSVSVVLVKFMKEH